MKHTGQAIPQGSDDTSQALIVQLPGFRGPLRELLQLVERGEMDVITVSLAEVARQHAALVEGGPDVDADALAEYIALACRMLYIKAAAVLNPQGEASLSGGKEDAEDEEELRRLIEDYRKIKEAARRLAELEERGQQAYPRLAPAAAPLPPGLQGVTLEALLGLAREALRRHPPAPEGVITPEPITIRRKMEELTATVVKAGRISLRQLMMACPSRLEVVVTFLAVLELLASGQIEAQQDQPFGDITLLAPSSPSP